MVDDLSTIVDRVSTELTQATEDYLLSVFGSVEFAQKVAHLYVLEYERVDLEPFGVPHYEGGNLVYRITQRVRVRPKTEEELEHDRNNQP